jgi:hypothetical protein
MHSFSRRRLSVAYALKRVEVARRLGCLENWPKASSRASLERPGASSGRRFEGRRLLELGDGGCWNWRRLLLQLGGGGG